VLFFRICSICSVAFFAVVASGARVVSYPSPESPLFARKPSVASSPQTAGGKVAPSKEASLDFVVSGQSATTARPSTAFQGVVDLAQAPSLRPDLKGIQLLAPLMDETESLVFSSSCFGLC
jgi:hypothetical protein